MRVVVTGAEGFVGPHVVNALKQRSRTNCELLLTAHSSAAGEEERRFAALDITDAAAVNALISDFKPTHVIHLAGMAAATDATRDPDQAWQVNLHGTLHIARALMKYAADATLIFAGSGLAYGQAGKAGTPLDETAVMAPSDEYGATKAAADLALGAFAARGLRAIRFRPFNHTGPGQAEAFVVPGFAMQIARIEAGYSPPVIRVGNLEAERDFLDVRDVARAYVAAVNRAEEILPGTVLNLASGKSRRIRDILTALLRLSTVSITVESDLSRMRLSDVPRIAGDASRAWRLLSWEPRVPFDATLADVLADCRVRVRYPE